MRAWRTANPDKVSAQNARYRKKHAAEIAQKREAKRAETNAKQNARNLDKSRNHLPPAEWIVVGRSTRVPL